MPWSVEKALSVRPPALPEKQRRIGSSEVRWFESEPGVAVILSEGGTVDDRFLAYVVTRDELAACGIRNATFSFDSALGGGGESGEDNVSWTPDQYGKGILTQDGVLHMWGTGYDNDGDPIHAAYARQNGIEDPHTRFWIHPQGDIHGYTQPQYGVGTNHTEEELMHYVRQHIPAAQYMGVGYPFDSAIENASPSMWEDEPDSRFIAKTANWNDIMAKAKRLLQSGNVTLLRNGYNIIVAHVIGDHGEYTCEISRDDPNSRAITQWTCECPWDQFAFQRTRQWKKYEGRPCAHVLAAYWLSQGTPLDEDSPPGQEQRGGPGGGAPTGGPLMTPEPFQPRLPVPGQPGPDGGAMPPLPPATQDQFGAPPPSASPYPPEAQQPMQMFAPPMDNNIIPPYPMDPATYQQPVSVPGGRPGPYPANPLQQPGTLSKIIVAGKGDEFPAGVTARMEEATYGQSEGREGATDAGQWVEIPKNAMVEVVYQDPSTGWVEVLYPLRGGAMTSYHARCFVEPDKLTPFSGADSPMAPKRRL